MGVSGVVVDAALSLLLLLLLLRPLRFSLCDRMPQGWDEGNAMSECSDCTPNVPYFRHLTDTVH